MKKRPVKSFNRLVVKKKRRRPLDPATRLLIVQIVSGLGVFSILALMIAGVWYGSRLEVLTIRTVQVHGGQTISHDDVVSAAEGALVGSYFALVPRRFAWTYPAEEVASAVTAISRVKDPVVERISGTELAITINEYIPYALWCDDNDEHACLFIDNEGVAFAVAPVLEGGSLYRFFTLGTQPAIKTVMREGVAIQEVVALAEGLEANFSLPVTKIELDSVGDVFFRIVGGGEVKATLTQSPTSTLENLALVLSTDEFNDIEPGNFQYIDLRFGSKVFVNDTVPEIATTTTDLDITTEAESPPGVIGAVVQQLADVDEEVLGGVGSVTTATSVATTTSTPNNAASLGSASTTTAIDGD